MYSTPATDDQKFEQSLWEKGKKYYKKQQDAFDEPRASGSGSLIIARDMNTSALKSYYPFDSPVDYYIHYNMTKPLAYDKRHHYEVIRDKMPFKPFFDIDIPFELDGGISKFADMIYKYVDAIKITFKKFDKELSDLDFIVLVSDIGPTIKYSAHIIVPTLRLYDMAKMKEIYQTLVSVLQSQGEGLEPFVDSAVYTKNRLFRMIWSSKYGKYNTLKLYDFSRYWGKDCVVVPEDVPTDKIEHYVEMQVMMNSLVSYTHKLDYVPMEDF